ncbi:retrovirus-related pol polyprotein from transposon TNT 1-94 [Tanacetum coccineum]
MNGDRSQLTNFIQNFLGTVKFGNDQIEKIIGYSDYQIGNITISKVYYVEGLGHNLFSVGQFCDTNLELTFRKHMCFVCNLEGVDLLSGSQETNLYTLSIRDMIASSPISLLSKASKTKSWLWHRRFSHLNFGAINHLEKNGLVRGLPKLKFEKDHLCSACAMGKSKKQSHKPKFDDTNQEKLYLLHMDLCGPMRVASLNGKKYILVIVDDYSWFTWVKFLASKDEAPYFIIKFLKMIQVRLNAPVRNICTDNGTELVNQTLCSYYELQTDAMWCYFDAFLTSVKPKNFKQAMTEPSWINAMQEEIYEFERLQVWELVPCAVDPTLFTWKSGNDLLLVQIYVDDIIFASTNTAMCNEFANLMTHKVSKMSMMGQMSFFLGLQISQSPKGIFLNQSKYAFEVIKKYGLLSSVSVDTPMVEKRKLDEVKPTKKHLNEVKRIFRYLKGTINMGLWYSKDNGDKLVSLSSKKQKRSTISSTEAKYIALSGCLRLLYALPTYNTQDPCTLMYNTQDQKKIQFLDRKPRNENHVSGSAKMTDRGRGQVKNMNTLLHNKFAHNNSLVAHQKRLNIEKCNARIAISKPQREETYQVTLEALKLSPCYPTFQITVEVLEIYMHQLWNTINKIGNSDAYNFKLDKKKCRVDTEVFRKILQICPILPNKEFVELPLEEDLVSFIKELGASLGKQQNLIDSGNHKLKSCGYGAMILDHMINQAIKDSKAYKTYYNFATKKATPKKARKYKKVASPSIILSPILEADAVKKAKRVKIPTKKSTTAQTTGVVIRDTPGVSDSSNTDVLDLPCLLVLITVTSQSRQHVDYILIHIESRKFTYSRAVMMLAQPGFLLHCEYIVSLGNVLAQSQG